MRGLTLINKSRSAPSGTCGNECGISFKCRKRNGSDRSFGKIARHPEICPPDFTSQIFMELDTSPAFPRLRVSAVPPRDGGSASPSVLAPALERGDSRALPRPAWRAHSCLPLLSHHLDSLSCYSSRAKSPWSPLYPRGGSATETRRCPVSSGSPPVQAGAGRRPTPAP